MLYFHLDTTHYINTTPNDTQDIGPIQVNFFNDVFSQLSNARAYMNGWSEDPIFVHLPTVKGKKWLLTSIDDESVDTEPTEIISLMEEAQSVILPDYGKSLNDMGLHFDYVGQIANKQVESSWADYMAEDNLQYIEEAMGDRNMSLPEKIKLLSSELIKIGSAENQLTIVDPYIFPKKYDDDYCDLFLGIIQTAEVSSVKIIADQRKTDSAICDSIKSRLSALSIPMYVYFSGNYHDRWWIIESKRTGIVCGTSLNGFGKGKLSTIRPLGDQDVEKIIADISEVFE